MYYIRLGDNVRGPYSVEDLRELADSNRFGPMYEVSPDRKRWKPADEIPQLFPKQSHARAARKRSAKSAPPPSAAPPLTSTAQLQPATDLRAATPPVQQGESLWRYAVDGHPADTMVSLDALRVLVSTRSISDQSLVWREGMADWVPVYLVPELDSAMLAAESHEGPASPESAASSTAAAGLGGVAYAALLVCTVMLVTRMRDSSFTASDHLPVFLLMGIDFLLGMSAVILGHMAIVEFQSGNQRHRRGRIVIGLSAGYTVLIILVLLSIAVVTTGSDSANDDTTAQRPALIPPAVVASSRLPAFGGS